MHGQYSGQLSDWRARCEAAEAKHAAANIQVQIIVMIVVMIISGDDHQGGGIAVQIDNYQVETLQGLEREVARLQAEVTIKENMQTPHFSSFL